MLFVPVTLSAATEETPAFKVIEVRQTGGFAGVEISYRITPDGKFTRKGRRGTAEGKLDAKVTKALLKAVAAIDWDILPAKLRATNVAEGDLSTLNEFGRGAIRPCHLTPRSRSPGA